MPEEHDICPPVKSFKAIPKPKEHWLKGSIGLFQPEEFHLYLRKLRNNLGSIYKIHFMKKPVIVVSDSKTVFHILKNRPGKFRRVSQIEAVFKELGIHGAFSAEGSDWRRHRKLLNPSFKPSQLKKFYPSLQEITERLCGKIEEQNEFDFQKLIQRYTVDITTLLAFGYNLNTLDNPESELQKSLDLVFPRVSQRLKTPFPYWRYFKLKCDRELDAALVKIRERVSVFIDAAQERLNNGKEPSNILESMLSEKDHNPEDIFGNSITLLLAGEDTTAHSIAWAIYYLIKNPEMQALAQQEIDRQYPSERKLDWDDLDDFPYIFGAIQESIRLKPVVQYLYFEAKEDLTLNGYRVPKGVMITTLLSANSEVDELFNNPKAFEPKRWMGLDDQFKHDHANTLFPFGAGSRLCPGMQLAFVEMKLALIELLRNYTFEQVAEAGEVKESCEFTIRPKNLIVKATKRSFPQKAESAHYEELDIV